MSKEAQKKYRENHREELNAKSREYYRRNHEKILLKMKQHYKQHKEEHSQRTLDWKKQNPEKVKAIYKRWRNSHRQQELTRTWQWRKKNPEHVRAYKRQYYREHPEQLRNYYEQNKQKVNTRRQKWYNCPQRKLNGSISAAIYRSLKGAKNGQHWETLVGYNLNDLIRHLESLFQDGMCWSNYGKNGWHINHIIPVSFFQFKDFNDVEFKMCWRLENLQPLWRFDNQSKGVKMPVKSKTGYAYT